MNRRDFIRNAGKTALIFAGGLWLPELGILRPTDAEASFFQHAAHAQKFQTRVYAGVTAKLSTVAGTAFATQVSGSIPWNLFLNRRVAITDTGAKTAVGWVKAVGSGETLATTGGPLNDGELITNGSFALDASWTKGTGVTIAGTLLCDGTGAIYASIAASQASFDAASNGKLYRASNEVSLTSGNYSMFVLSPSITLCYRITTALNVLFTGNGGTQFTINNGGVVFAGYFDNVFCKQVLTPDSTGFTITSTMGGATQNFASIEAGFNPNSASFTVTVYES